MSLKVPDVYMCNYCGLTRLSKHRCPEKWEPIEFRDDTIHACHRSECQVGLHMRINPNYPIDEKEIQKMLTVGLFSEHFEAAYMHIGP